MKKLHCILLLLIIPFLSKATHQVCAYISLQYMGGYTYKATIVDFINGNPNSGGCNNTADRDTLRLNWGDGTSTIVYRSNGNGDSLCECRKVEKYTGTHTYSGPGTYRMWFDDPDRIANIQNMTTSVNQDIFIYHTLAISPFALDTSSPVITNPPVCTSGCPGQCYTFNLDAYSPAADSISYSLGSCLSLGGICVGYTSYNATINPLTGTLSWCNPVSTGIFNFAILMTTYNKVIIGGHPTQIPVDTEEVELSAIIDSACLAGINEIKNKTECAVYPNPSKGIFTIQSSVASNKLSVEVYNVLGEKVYSKSHQPLANSYQPMTIDLSSQPNGMYLYRVLTEAGALVSEGKFIIQK